MNVESRTAVVKLGTLVLLAYAGLCLICQFGCGAKPSAVDSAPFVRAVEQYLQANRMELKLKNVKSGPVIDQDRATMTASLTHAELSGPAVTWNLTFERQADGTWKVLEHSVAK